MFYSGLTLKLTCAKALYGATVNSTFESYNTFFKNSESAADVGTPRQMSDVALKSKLGRVTCCLKFFDSFSGILSLIEFECLCDEA